MPWRNRGRCAAYELSPYDTTLLLDVDYVVASSKLKDILELPYNFLCHKDAWDLGTGRKLAELNTFGRHKMPMWWATVMMFQRSTLAEYIFDSMTMVRHNWQHYRDLYGIDRSTYRNDFALSISLGIVSGHTLQIEEIPWDLASARPEYQLEKLDTDFYQISYQTADKKIMKQGFVGQDFHAMGKQHLETIIANS